MKSKRTITQTFSLPLDLVERLDEVAHTLHKPRSRLVRESIRRLITSFDKGEPLDAPDPLSADAKDPLDAKR